MRKQNVAQNHLAFAIVIALSVFVSGGSAFGQFIVQPMRMDLPLMPKQRFETSLGLQSFDPNAIHEIDLSVVDLTQATGTPNIGERVEIIPNHVCTAVNLHEEIHVIESDEVVDTWRIAARGKVT